MKLGYKDCLQSHLKIFYRRKISVLLSILYNKRAVKLAMYTNEEVICLLCLDLLRTLLS